MRKPSDNPLRAFERARRRANEGTRGLWRMREALARAAGSASPRGPRAYGELFGLRMRNAFGGALDGNELYDLLLDDAERWLATEGRWLRQALAELEAEVGRVSLRRRIAALRNTTGRTPEEAAAYEAKARELERRLNT
jgi:hypothetical protein